MIDIRPFLPQDKPVYLSMSQDFYQSDAVDHSIPRKNYEITFLQSLSSSPYCKGYLICYKNQPAGYLLLSLTYSNEVGGLVILLEEIYILPQLRGKGIARHCFDWLFQTFPEAKRYRLEVTPVNAGAIRLYQRMGFKEISYLQMSKDAD